MEGSGIDMEAAETGVYSSAAPWSIYIYGKSFKCGVAYHTMMMKFESLGDLPLGPGNNCGNRKKRIALE